MTSDTRRVARLFRPYRRRLTAVLAFIAVSAGLGMITPFLLRAVLDDAIPDADTGLLSALVAGMIATPTCSASRSRSSRARAPARCSRASPTTSAACRTS
jgi:ABC-type bacteriocin/lantibiotic exporter with double-glycine peptidase domain